MIEYFKLALSKYSDFNGRSRRSEYWYFALVNVLLSIAASLVDFGMGFTGDFTPVESLLSLALFLPGLAVGVRRLHDIGKSGWWLLIVLTIIGIFVLLFWYLQDSEPGENQYGPNPKDPASRSFVDNLVEDDLV